MLACFTTDRWPPLATVILMSTRRCFPWPRRKLEVDTQKFSIRPYLAKPDAELDLSLLITGDELSVHWPISQSLLHPDQISFPPSSIVTLRIA
jgi:hypothetical protein